MLDRLVYALIGFVFGAVLAALGWWLYGIGMSSRLPDAKIDPLLSHWIRYVGGAFAIVGFLFKERAASAIGDVFAGIFHFETSNDSKLNWWQSLIILAIIAAAFWALWQSTP